MKLHREGNTTIFLSIAIFLALNVCAWMFLPRPVAIPVSIVTAVVLALVINFFRRPHRHAVRMEGAVVCPCDGRVVTIEETFEPEVLKCQVLQVSIFMSVTNVHINWFPVSGTVSYYRHHDGKKMAAYLPKSSSDNERSSIVIDTPDGKKVLLRQVAGALARRVVSYVKEGQQVKQSDELGFIKFGSRVDLYLPIGTKVDVNLKDNVVGSQTIIGWLK
ncbi:MAG: phosphatidylserine decarboxylase family protein [Bacteroidales bacterium]|nr:phosphatidylserine decarboxylase family protein [Bacteroidales bacterium]